MHLNNGYVPLCRSVLALISFKIVLFWCRGCKRMACFVCLCVSILIVCLCAGLAERYECCRDYRQAWVAFAASTQLVHPSDMCHQRWRPLRRSGLVIQPAEESEIDRLQEHCHHSYIFDIISFTALINNNAVFRHSVALVCVRFGCHIQ